MLNVGLTGNIASGKSLVTEILGEKGAFIIDSDELVHRLQSPGSPMLRDIAEEFGGDMIGEDGSLDRAALRRVVFGDSEARARLNSIVHPEVARERESELQRARQDGAEIVIQDIPLLFEVMDPAEFDLVILVDAPEDLRMKRLMKRSNLNQQDASAIISSQQPSAKKRDKADFVIDNVGTVEDLRSRVLEVWKELQARVR